MTFFTSLYRPEKRAPAGHQMLDFNFQGQNALNLFFRPGQWIKITETSLINSSLSNQKGANICLKCTRRVDFPSRLLSSVLIVSMTRVGRPPLSVREALYRFHELGDDNGKNEPTFGIRTVTHRCRAPSPC